MITTQDEHQELAHLRAEVHRLQADSSRAIAALAERIGERDRLQKALEAITRRVPIMGSRDEYRRGQDHALEACREVAEAALKGGGQ